VRTVPDYLRLIWNILLGQQKRDPDVRYLSAERSIIINTDQPLPVQGDGEVIGHTPVQVQVAPKAVDVIVPAGVEDERR
jgi:diacylglycerol kinase (ATP)